MAYVSGGAERATVIVSVVLLVIAGSLGVLAWMLSPEFVEQRVAADGHIDEISRAQVGLLRFALGGLSLLTLIVWLVRKILVRDVIGAITRFRNYAVHEHVPAPDLFGSTLPRPVIIGLLLGAVSWVIVTNVSFLLQWQWPGFLLTEYGVLENLTVVVYVIAALLALLLMRAHRGPPGLYRWWLLLLATFCMLVALEETNWGQVYLQYETPELFRVVNVQQDTSIHNLLMPHTVALNNRAYWANDMSWWLAFAGAAFPWLIMMSRHMKRLVAGFEIPVPPLQAQAFFMAAALVVSDDFLFGMGMRPTEMREVSIAVAFALWLWCECRRHHLLIDLTPASSPATSRDAVPR